MFTEPRDSDDFEAGVDYAIEALAEVLEIDVNSFSHDAATETLEGDVKAVIGNALNAALGDDWTDQLIDNLRSNQGAEILARLGIKRRESD